MKTYTAKQLEKMDANELRLLVIKIQESKESELQNIINQNRRYNDLYFNNQKLVNQALSLGDIRKLTQKIETQMDSWSQDLKALGFKVEREPYY